MHNAGSLHVYIKRNGNHLFNLYFDLDISVLAQIAQRNENSSPKIEPEEGSKGL